MKSLLKLVKMRSVLKFGIISGIAFGLAHGRIAHAETESSSEAQVSVEGERYCRQGAAGSFWASFVNCVLDDAYEAIANCIETRYHPKIFSSLSAGVLSWDRYIVGVGTKEIIDGREVHKEESIAKYPECRNVLWQHCREVHERFGLYFYCWDSDGHQKKTKVINSRIPKRCKLAMTSTVKTKTRKISGKKTSDNRGPKKISKCVTKNIGKRVKSPTYR